MLNVSNKNKKYVLAKKMSDPALRTVLSKASLLTFLFVLLTSLTLSAGNTMPSTFTYQGRLMDSSGTAGLAGNLTLYIEVRNPSGACLLYSEHQAVNTTTTGGLFSIQIGNGTRTSGVAGYSNDPGYAFSTVFTNKDDFPIVAGSCAGGWTPGATDARALRIHVYDGVTTTTLADQALSPVPQALVADTIDGVPLQGLTLNWTTVTRPLNPVANATHGYNRTLTRFEIWNGAAWVPTTPKFSAAVIGDTATNNYVLKWNDATDVWEPSDIGTLLGNPGGDVSGTYGNMNVEAIQGQPVATTAPNLNEVLKWNGSEWEAAVDAGGVVMAGGAGATNRLTKFNASDELADSSITDDGTTVTFSIPLDMSAQQIKDVANPSDPGDAVTLNYLEQYVEPGTVDDQILRWDNTAQAWEAATLASTGTTISGGTQNILPKFNPTGDNIVDSSITDNGTNVLMENPPVMRDAQILMTRNGSDLLFAHTSDANTAASFSTYVGYMTGNTTVTGNHNTSFGYNNLNSVTTGYQNVAIGSSNMASNTTGYNNVSVGQGALGLNVSGAYNIALGQALNSLTAGDSNIAIGQSSLGSINTGINNVALGRSAGFYAASISSRNVFIGNEAGPSGATAMTDKLYIDNSANDNPLIYGDFSDNYLRINNILELPEITTPADAVAGYGRIYFKSDGLYIKMGSTEAKLVTGTGAGEVNTASSLGGTADVYKQKTGVDLEMRGISGGTNITVTENANDITIDATGVPTAGGTTNDTLRWDGDSWEPTTGLTIEADGDVVLANAPTADAHSTTKLYVDNAVNGIAIADGSANGQLLRWNGTDWVAVTLTSGQFLVGDGATPSVATAVTMSSDATMSAAGAVTIANSAVTTAKIANATILFEDIAANGCTGDQSIGRNAGNTAWECKTSGSGMTGSGTQYALPMFNNAGGTTVGDSLLAQNSTSANNEITLAGTRALSNKGTNNFFIANSGNNTFTTGSAVRNLAAGNTALDALTTGTDNIAIGFNAAGAITTGANNIAIGANALATATTTSSDGNIAIGVDSLRVMNETTSNGRFNTSIGSEAMQGVTKGAQSVAIGAAALGGGFGSYELSNSVAVGYGALMVSNPGEFAGNDALGSYSLYSSTTGADNVAIGFQAMNTVTTGGSNTALGRKAGKNANAGSAGNLFLGYESGPTATGAVSDKLYIDNSANDTPLIYGDFSANQLGINSALVSTHALSVGGEAYKTAGTTAWVIPSDGRLKDVDGKYEYGLAEILKLNTVRYHYKKNNAAHADSEKPKIGFIAQEVMSVIPEAVELSDDGYYSLNVDPIHWAVVNAVQELGGMSKMSQKQMASIDQRLSKAERKIASLEEQAVKQQKEIDLLKQQVQLLMNEIKKK
ncbi:MAG: tail fiber domain-containing protein [Bdellovibrionota bacterium]